jgi:hypothetical protein
MPLPLKEGLWLLPTKGRIKELKRFLNAAREMGTGTPGMILVNQSEMDADPSYYHAIERFMLDDWSLLPVKAESYGDAIRAVWPRIRDKAWVGLLADDLIPATSTWDKALIARLHGWNFVSSNDGWQAPHRMHGAVVFSGDLLRAVGWLFPPKLRHVFHDDIWEGIGRDTGCWHQAMDVMVKHLHESLSGIKGPTVDPQSELWKHDQAVFTDWIKSDSLRAVEAVRELQARYNIKAVQPKFDGVRCMIATATIDGKYESTFVQSLFHTMKLLSNYNVVVEWAEEKYTADICLARSKLLGAFMRSQCTHLLMIDADMGWGPEAVVRLFAANKDFICVSGPKKRYPLSFAANHVDADGVPIPLKWDPETGTMELSEVGLAFSLITRSVAEQMIASYPEVKFLGVTQEVEYALFNPLIEHNRYYSEDFAFCRRWTRIGGQVFICPDIRLTHTGHHTFEGAFIEAVQDSMRSIMEAKKLAEDWAA